MCKFSELTRIISNTKKTAKAAPKARSRNFGWKENYKVNVISKHAITRIKDQKS